MADIKIETDPGDVGFDPERLTRVDTYLQRCVDDGFGLGFSVDLDPIATGRPGSIGSYGWGGAASTLFWVDPVEHLTAMFFTQVLTLSPLPLRGTLRQLVYQALVDGSGRG